LDKDQDLEIAIAAESVMEATPLTEKIQPLPASVPFLEGIMHLRNAVIPVINMKKRMGLDNSSEYGSDAKIAVILLANQKFDAEVALTVVRKGFDKYRGQFITRSDSNINTLEDIGGKIIAYTDAASTSGYIYPSALLIEKGIQPEKYFFAGGHPQAVLAVYSGKADVGCAFWTPVNEEDAHDARSTVIETHPDVMEKIKIIGFTEWIPNATVTFRKDFPPEMKEKIVEALLEFANDDKDRETLKDLLEIDNFIRASNEDYDSVREAMKIIGEDDF